MRPLLRAIPVALLGGLAGAAALVTVAAWYPAIAFEMDRELPSYVSGFYPLERDGQRTFAWTAERATVTLAGLDRRIPWECGIAFRGARPSDDQQPGLVAAVDGVRAGEWLATNEFQEARLTVGPTPTKPGLVLSFTSTRIYEPAADPRRLGVQVDRLWCEPASGIMLPPRHALGGAAAAAAVMGAGFAVAGITAGSAAGGAVLMAIGQAFALVSGGALYGAYPWGAARLAFAMAIASLLLSAALRLSLGQPLRNTARFVLTFSVGGLYLQLLALLHPAKSVVDAVFHAHRFEQVLAGQLYFTQLSTSATPFPYAIGLYLFSAPWALLVTNHVALLRVVVSSWEMLAGALLYPLVVKTSGNRLAGAVAAALFSLVPLSYTVIGNANLTNAFGQAVSIVTIAVVAIHAERLRRPVVFTGVVALATLGLVSHISTLVLLTSTLLVLAVLFWRRGGQPLRGAARAVVAVTAISAAASVLIYWGHFGDVFRLQIDRARAAVSSTAEAGGAPARTRAPADPSAMGERTISLGGRVRMMLDQTLDGVGWPILLLALVGLWRAFADDGGGRLDLAIAGWAIVWLVFISAGVLLPGNKGYQQDAYEFIARVVHAAVPAAVLLAARGATWLWRADARSRAASMALLAWAVVTGVRAWTSWLS